LLYLTSALALGLIRYTGGKLSWAMTEPGRIGDGLAQFFTLNLGVLGTLFVAFALLALATVLFGFRLPIYLFQAVKRNFTESKIGGQKSWKNVKDAKIPAKARSGLFQPENVSFSASSPEPWNDMLLEDAKPVSPNSQPSENREEEEHPESVAPHPAAPEMSGAPASETLVRAAPASVEQSPSVFAKTPSVEIKLVETKPSGDKKTSASDILGELLASLEAENPPPALISKRLPEVRDFRKNGPGNGNGAPNGGNGENKGVRERISKTMEEILEEKEPLVGTGAMARSGFFDAKKKEKDADGPPSATRKAFLKADPLDKEETGPLRSGLFPPPLDIFGPSVRADEERDSLELADKQAEIIVETLQNFGVKASVAHIVAGPSVIQFQLELAPGVKVSKVSGLSNDLTMALAVVSVRVEAPILGQRYVGIEIPNTRRKGIALRSIVESEDFQNSEYTLPLPMGVRVDSKHLICGLEDMPHLLVAGTTGSGKSVFTNTCILGMCSRRSPGELKLLLVDPKHVEFAIYEGLPHLLARPVSDPKKAVAALGWAVQEMENRSEAFARAKVRNLASYNEKVLPKSRFPHLVVVVDELADLMYTAGKEVEGLIARLAQKARAAGIHLILATQRPSVDVITGLIKANVPARVAFAVPSQTDSRTIIDTGGAEKLLGKGDMLFYSSRYPRPIRLQASFITEERTLEFVEYMKNAFGEPDYIDFDDFSGAGGSGAGNGERSGNSIVGDPKLEEAIKTIMETRIASASGLQRYLNVGYPRAGRLIMGLEQLGIVGPQTVSPSKPREILMDEGGALEVLERARCGV
jgi:DNA segregation ATPase FtsK/SpoIIIE-like protein